MCSKKLFQLITFEFCYGENAEEGLEPIEGMAVGEGGPYMIQFQTEWSQTCTGVAGDVGTNFIQTVTKSVPFLSYPASQDRFCV